MYIIEKLIKLFSKKEKTRVIIPEQNDNPDLEDVLTCKHTFMPIDSTGKILACSKCGYLVTKKRAKKEKNFFDETNQ